MIYVICRFYLPFQGTRKAVATKMGPNDASGHIIWAISMFFFCISCLMLLTIFLLLYLATKKVREGNDNINGPKRRIQMCHLGHKYVFFFTYFMFYVY